MAQQVSRAALGGASGRPWPTVCSTCWRTAFRPIASLAGTLIATLVVWPVRSSSMCARPGPGLLSDRIAVGLASTKHSAKHRIARRRTRCLPPNRDACPVDAGSGRKVSGTRESAGRFRKEVPGIVPVATPSTARSVLKLVPQAWKVFLGTWNLAERPVHQAAPDS
jgi:hypothetical protein